MLPTPRGGCPAAFEAGTMPVTWAIPPLLSGCESEEGADSADASVAAVFTLISATVDSIASAEDTQRIASAVGNLELWAVEIITAGACASLEGDSAVAGPPSVADSTAASRSFSSWIRRSHAGVGREATQLALALEEASVVLGSGCLDWKRDDDAGVAVVFVAGTEAFDIGDTATVAVESDREGAA